MAKLKYFFIGILLGVAVTSTLLMIFDPLDVFAQGPPPGGGPPKVDIFARQTAPTSILVTWENPDDTEDNVVFAYTVLRDVNKSDIFVTIFNSIRDIEEKIIDENNGQEMFFYLDNDIDPGNFYTYAVTVQNTQGNPNPVLSDDTRPIFINPQVQLVRAESYGHLIVGRTLTPITPIISFIELFNPFQLVHAEDNVSTIFTTSINPQSESFRLALEPVPRPDSSGNCDQILEFEYSRNIKDGQDFEIVATIFENEIQTDDDTGTEVPVEVEILRYQKTFHDFSDTTKLKQKWLTIPTEEQTIVNFTNIEVQYDITGEFKGDPFEHRNLSFHETLFLVPLGNNAC